MPKSIKANEVIRFIYEKSHLTYNEISKLTDVKKDTLAGWITRRRNPPSYTARMIFEKLKRFLDDDSKQTAQAMIDHLL